MQITDFTVGLGLDTSDLERGAKRAESILEGYRSDVLQLGATLATAFGAKALTFDFARENDQLRQMASMLSVSTDALYGLDEAAKSFGARGGEMVGVLSGLAEARNRFRDLGELGIFGDLAKLGVDIDRLTSARTEMEAMYALADEMAKLDPGRAQIAANIVGLSPQVLDMMRQGSDDMRELSRAYQEARPHTEAMADASRNLISQWNLLEAEIGGRADRISTPLVKGLGEITASMNDWIAANRALIDQKIDDVMETIGKNIEVLTPLAIAFTGSGILVTFAGLAKHVPLVGGAIAGMATGLAKIVPLVGAVAAAFELWDWDEKTFKEKFGIDLPDWMFKPLGEVFDDVTTVERTPGDRMYDAIDIGAEGVQYVGPTEDSPLAAEDLKGVRGPSLGREAPQLPAKTEKSGDIVIQNTFSVGGEVIDRRTTKVVTDMFRYAYGDGTGTVDR